MINAHRVIQDTLVTDNLHAPELHPVSGQGTIRSIVPPPDPDIFEFAGCRIRPHRLVRKNEGFFPRDAGVRAV